MLPNNDTFNKIINALKKAFGEFSVSENIGKKFVGEFLKEDIVMVEKRQLYDMIFHIAKNRPADFALLDKFIKTELDKQGWSKTLDTKDDEKLELIKYDLQVYFERNKVCGRVIRSFEVRWCHYLYPIAEIVLLEKYFSNYQDENADKYIRTVGARHGVRLAFEESVRNGRW